MLLKSVLLGQLLESYRLSYATLNLFLLASLFDKLKKINQIHKTTSSFSFKKGIKENIHLFYFIFGTEKISELSLLSVPKSPISA